MGSELVSGSLSSDDEGSGSQVVAPLKTYTDTFNEQFPYYLSIGMTEEQYWDRDCMLVKFYREADELRTEKISFEAWLQGKYVYDAICATSPILHAFAKKGTKPVPYMNEPYPVTKAKAQKQAEDKAKASYTKNKTFMETFMIKYNKQFEVKEG